MREGDCIYFKQPFQPNSATAKIYQCGIVVAIVADESIDTITDVLVQLYDPDQDATYTDEFEATVLYRFLWDELKSSKD